MFRVGSGGEGTKRDKLSNLLLILERRLKKFLSANKKELTSIYIKEGRININETCDSRNLPYLIYTTYLFLEDYLTKEYLRDGKKRLRLLGEITQP